jgi:hypothetical protein
MDPSNYHKVSGLLWDLSGSSLGARRSCGYLWIPNHFSQLSLAGRTTIICGFHTNFRLWLWWEEQRLFADSKLISAHCLWQEEQQLFFDSKPISAHSLWREEQRLFVDSKPISACVFDCLWREEQRLFVDSKPFSACVFDCLWREEQRLLTATATCSQ